MADLLIDLFRNVLKPG